MALSLNTHMRQASTFARAGHICLRNQSQIWYFVSDPWNWVMSWKEIIPSHNMIVMLEKTFFPKWLQVLSAWLNNNPDYDEVTKWYLGWKSMIPEEFLAHQSIKGRIFPHFKT